MTDLERARKLETFLNDLYSLIEKHPHPVLRRLYRRTYNHFVELARKHYPKPPQSWFEEDFSKHCAPEIRHGRPVIDAETAKGLPRPFGDDSDL